MQVSPITVPALPLPEAFLDVPALGVACQGSSDTG